MHSGSVRVYPLQPGDHSLTSMKAYWALSIHDNQYGHLRHIRCGHDDHFVLTAGDDGNIFSFSLLPPEELQKSLQRKRAKVPSPRVSSFFFFFCFLPCLLAAQVVLMEKAVSLLVCHFGPAESSQQLMDELSFNFVQAFVAHTWYILLTFGIPWLFCWAVARFTFVLWREITIGWMEWYLLFSLLHHQIKISVWPLY